MQVRFGKELSLPYYLGAVASIKIVKLSNIIFIDLLLQKRYDSVKYLVFLLPDDLVVEKNLLPINNKKIKKESRVQKTTTTAMLVGGVTAVFIYRICNGAN